MKLIIDNIDKLTKNENNVIKYHSLVNILNVVGSHLQMLHFDLTSESKSQPERLQTLVESVLTLPKKIEHGISRNEILKICKNLKLEIQTYFATNRRNLKAELDSARIDKLELNINSILNVFSNRLDEFYDSSRNKIWKKFRIVDLYSDITKVLKAVEKNSDNRYSITFCTDNKSENDYLIIIDITSLDNKSITLPPVASDIFRDLILNSRKYSKPGTTIKAKIIENDEFISIIVEDEGFGIPKKEISKVSNYGFRGSNIKHIKTNGGSCGLTKAYLASKKYNGTMSIESEQNKGTIITIIIPKP